VGQAEPEAFRLHTVWHVVLVAVATHTDPGWQSSGKVEHVLPTPTECSVEQSHTVLSVLATPVSPAMKTQLKLARALPQLALPVGLHVSIGGEQKNRLFTAWPVTSSTMVLAVQRLLLLQSSSVRQVL
jgi:hypothetical protein